MITLTDNALHAAEIWLDRINEPPTATAVVDIKPAAVGVWVPGAANVRVLAGIDDAAVDLCEAIAPAVQEALAQLDEDQRAAVVGMFAQGARLQALLNPAAGSIGVRLIRGGQSVSIADLERIGPFH